MDIFVLAFLAVAILSAIFSVDKNSSIYGFYGRFNNGLLGLLSLGALYFLITNNVGEKKIEISKILKLFLWSSFLIILTGYFSVFSVWAKINNLIPLPQTMVQQTFNPVAGSLEGLSVFLAVFTVFLTGLLLVRKEKNTLLWPLFAASLVLMVLIDFTPAWVVVLTTLVLLVGFSLWQRLFKENVNRLLIPIFLIIITAVLIPFRIVDLNLPQEQTLAQSTSWQVGFKGATDSVKAGFLGSGLSTFYYDFAKEKPAEINQTWLWQIRFDRAGNYVAETLGTSGFLGLISYLGLVAIFLLISWFVIGRQFNSLPLLLAFLALVVGNFVYYQNNALAFMFWLALGLAVISWQRPVSEKTVSFKNFPELSLVFSTLTIVLGVIILVLYFFGVKFYLADVNYSKSLVLLGDERIAIMEKAVKLNASLPQYRSALARVYLADVLLETKKPAAEQDSVKIQNRVAQAINQAMIATSLQPNQVANWEVLGVIYREIKQLASGATDWGIKSFERAIELEPTNPVLYTELGKLYIAAGDTEKAQESFQRATEQKSDYADAQIQQAMLLEQAGDASEAIAKLESLIQANPYSVEVIFQLGRLYFNNGQVDEAIKQFKGATILAPDHSNARYSLGVAYVAQGKNSLALEEFKKVLELNPGNEDVIKKIRDLQK